MATDIRKIEWVLSAMDRASPVFRGIETSMDRLQGSLAKLGIGLSAGYFGFLIKGAIDSADRLNDLSKSTDISVEDLAGLQLLAKQTGTDLDGLAKGINKMSVEMGKDPEKFRALGVTAKDNKEAFKQLADIFNLLPDIQQRNALAQAVFSKSWAEMASALSEGGKRIGEIIDRGARLSGVTKEMTQQADAFNDKLAVLTGTGGLLTRLVGPMLPLLNSLADDLLKAGEKTESLNSSFKPLAETLKALIILGANTSFVFQTLGKDMARAVENIKLIARGDFAGSRALGEMFRKDAADARQALDAYEQKILGLGLTGKSAPGAPPVDPAAAAAAKARASAFLARGQGKDSIETLLKAGTAGWIKYADAVKEAYEAELKALAPGESFTLWAEKNRDAALDNIDPTRKWAREVKDLTALFETGYLSLQQFNAAAMDPRLRALLQQSKTDFDVLNAALKEGDINLDQYTEAVKRLRGEVDKTSDFAREMGLTFSSAFEDAIVTGRELSDVIKALGLDIARIITRKAITEPFGKMVSDTIGGSGLFKNLFGGGEAPLATAAGGSRNAGQLLLVGEEGPELFVPPTAGTVVPNHKLGGGDTNNHFNVDMRGASLEAVARLERLVASVNGSIERRALNVMGQARVRGAG